MQSDEQHHGVGPHAADGPRGGRRQFLQKVGAGAAVAWTAPVILSASAASAATVPVVIPFMATGSDGSTRNFFSTNAGTSWTNGGAASGTEMHAVAYTPFGGGKWIAVGRDAAAGTLIFTSTNDGASWTSIAPTPTGRLLGVATDGLGNWVAVGQTVLTFPGNHLILFSNDNGVTWNTGTLPVVVNQLHAIATDRLGRWVAVGQNNSVKGIVTISNDNGATWSAPIVLDPVQDAQVIGVATDGAGRWIAGGSFTNTVPNATAVLWNATGNNISTAGDWTPNTSIGDGYVYGIASDRASTFVAVGQRDDPAGGAFSYTIQAGIAAGTFPGVVARQLHEVATDRQGNWVAVGFDTGGGPMRTYTSVDNGLNWSVTASPDPSGILLGVAAKILE